MPPVEGMPGVVAARPRTEEYYRYRDTLQGVSHDVAVVEHVVRGDFGGIAGGDNVAIFVPKTMEGDLLETAKRAAVLGGYMVNVEDYCAVRSGLTYPRPDEPSPFANTASSEEGSRPVALLRRLVRSVVSRV